VVELIKQKGGATLEDILTPSPAKPSLAALFDEWNNGIRPKLKMRHFYVLTFPKESELVPSWAAGRGRDGGNERNDCNGGGRMYNR
jgi:hypothetical protein